MGWDYYTFLKQPKFFINELIILINLENNAINSRQNDQGMKTRIKIHKK